MSVKIEAHTVKARLGMLAVGRQTGKEHKYLQAVSISQFQKWKLAVKYIDR